MKFENAAIKVVSHSILVNAVVLFNCVLKENCSFFLLSLDLRYYYLNGMLLFRV